MEIVPPQAAPDLTPPLTDDELMCMPRTVVAVVITHALVVSRADTSLATEDLPEQAVRMADKLFATLRKKM